MFHDEMDQECVFWCYIFSGTAAVAQLREGQTEEMNLFQPKIGFLVQVPVVEKALCLLPLFYSHS